MNPGEEKAEFSPSSEFFKKLNQQIVQKDNLIKLLQLQIKNLKTQIEESAGEGPKKAEMAKLLESKETEIKNLEASLQTQKAELAGALAEKDEQIRALNQAVEQAQQKNQQAGPSEADEARLSELQSTVARLEAELKEEQEKRAEIEGRISGESEGSRQEIAKLQEELKHIGEEKDKVLANLIARESELAEAHGKLAQVDVGISSDLERRVVVLETDKDALKRKLEEKEQEISSLRAQLSSQGGPDASLAADLATAQADLAVARSELSTRKGELEALQKELTEARNLASSGQTHLAAIQAQAQRIQELEAKLARAEAEAASLSEAGIKLTLAESERAKWAGERESLQNSMREMGREIESLKQLLNEREGALNAQQSRMIELEKRYLQVSSAGENDPQVRQEIDQLTNQVADQLLAIQKFEQILRNTQEELDRRDEEIAQLKDKITETGAGKAISLANDSDVLVHFLDFFDGLDSYLLTNPIPELQALHRQLLDRLILPNQIEYMPVIAETFSPGRHVATDYFRSSRFGEKTIVFEVEKGYRRGDSVVKKAKVWVVQNLFACPSCDAMQTTPESRFCNLCGAKIAAPNGLPVDTLPEFEPTPTTYLRFADRMIELDRGDEAKKYLLDGLALDPEFIPSLTRLAEVHAMNSEFGEAIEVLQKVVAKRPDPKLIERIKALEVKNTIYKQAQHLNLPPGEFEKLVRLIKE